MIDRIGKLNKIDAFACFFKKKIFYQIELIILIFESFPLEFHVGKAVEYVKAGTEDTRKALKLQREARKVTFFL